VTDVSRNKAVVIAGFGRQLAIRDTQAIRSRRSVTVRELDASIGRNWIAHRIAEKKVEAEAESEANSA
jgi:hypothetical protein